MQIRLAKETQEACVELVKYLMKKLSISSGQVLRHFDIVNKRCPAPYVYNTGYKGTWTWDEFKSKLKGDDTSVTIILKQIKPGYQGKEAGIMQRLLKADGYYDGAVDNSYGPASEKAVRIFQKVHGLTIDGVCGPSTWHALLGV